MDLTAFTYLFLSLLVLVVAVLIPLAWLVWAVYSVTRKEHRADLEAVRRGLQAHLRKDIPRVKVVRKGRHLEIRCPLRNGHELCVGSIRVPKNISRYQVQLTIEEYCKRFDRKKGGS